MGRQVTDEELREIRARVEAATAGPWLTPEEAGGPSKVIDHEGCSVWPWESEADMIFAYKARTDIPRLLDEIERLRTELTEWHHKYGILSPPAAPLTHETSHCARGRTTP
jgi:hypothetical protein